MADRESLKAKIRALRAKAEDAGCTDAEARAFAAAAASLMASHSILDDEVARPPIVKVKKVVSGVQGKLPWTIIFVAINEAVGGRVWVEASSQNTSIIYLAFEPEAAIADYLHDVAVAHVARGRKAFYETDEYKRRRKAKTKREAVAAWLNGFLRGLALVILEAFEGRFEPAEKDKRRALLDQYMTKTDIRLGQSRQGKPKNFVGHAAYQAGRQAGQNVSIRDGVTSQRAPKLIGRP